MILIVYLRLWVTDTLEVLLFLRVIFSSTWPVKLIFSIKDRCDMKADNSTSAESKEAVSICQ